MLNPSDSVKSHIAEVALYMTSRHTISMKTHFCKYCGNRFEPWKNKSWLEDVGCRLCCRDLTEYGYRGITEYGKTASPYYFCIHCGAKIGERKKGNHQRKLCEACKKLKTNKRAAKYIESHPNQYSAYELLKKYPDKMIVLYECPCKSNGRQKARHHPRYSKPFEVLLLCSACHRKEHARLNDLGSRPE